MKLKQLSYILMIIIASSLVLMPYADAWSWKTHSAIVDVVYYGLPVNVQQKLDLNIMRDGSNDPDQIFHDFNYHSYPKSYDKAEFWLNQGKSAYDNGNYANASYDYGVATHYISDTFSAPHTVSGESSSDHSKYENRAKKLTPTATYVNEDLNTMMQEGKNDGSSDWANWLQTNDDNIIQKDLNRGASASLSAVEDSLNVNNTVNNTKSESFLDYIIKKIIP